jgi:hypothetical protein
MLEESFALTIVDRRSDGGNSSGDYASSSSSSSSSSNCDDNDVQVVEGVTMLLSFNGDDSGSSGGNDVDGGGDGGTHKSRIYSSSNGSSSSSSSNSSSSSSSSSSNSSRRSDVSMLSGDVFVRHQVSLSNGSLYTMLSPICEVMMIYHHLNHLVQHGGHDRGDDVIVDHDSGSKRAAAWITNYGTGSVRTVDYQSPNLLEYITI